MPQTNRPRRPGTYTAIVHLRCPLDVRELLDSEAGRRRCTPSELARRLVLAGIEAEGLKLPTPA